MSYSSFFYLSARVWLSCGLVFTLMLQVECLSNRRSISSNDLHLQFFLFFFLFLLNVKKHLISICLLLWFKYFILFFLFDSIAKNIKHDIQFWREKHIYLLFRIQWGYFFLFASVSLGECDTGFMRVNKYTPCGEYARNTLVLDIWYHQSKLLSMLEI